MNIREAKPADVSALLAIYAPYVTETTITFETKVPTLADFQERIRTTQEKFPYLVAEVDSKVLGYAYAHPYYGRAAYTWTVELSIYVAQEARQQGLGQALYDALEKELEQQGVINLLACISLPNDASISFHEKRGYEQVAHFQKVGFKLGKWHDIVWLQKKLGNPEIPEPVVYKQH